jgi:hypothetical protein
MELGSHCVAAGVTVDRLLDCGVQNDMYIEPDKFTCGLILELNRFCRRKQLNNTTLITWIKCLSPVDPELSILDAVNNLKTKRDILRRKKKNKIYAY